MAIVRKGEKMGYINRQNQVVIPTNFDEAYDFSEGLAGVKIKGKFGFIDQTGKLVIPAEYDEIHYFADGLVKVGKGESVFYLNKEGKCVPYKGYNCNVEGIAIAAPSN
jgi:hypothetical protein